LAISEANIGVNKVNYFIKRKIEQDAVLDDLGTIHETVTVSYKNTSKKGQWPGGSYNNYIRFVLPKGALLEKVSIDNVEQQIVPAVTDFRIYEAKSFVPPVGLEVDTTNELGKTVYGMLVVIPEEQLKTLSISYVLPTVSMENPVIFYDLFLFKQPGTENDSYTFSLTYPGSRQIIKKSEGTTGSGQTVRYSMDFEKDTKFFVDLSKK